MNGATCYNQRKMWRPAWEVRKSPLRKGGLSCREERGVPRGGGRCLRGMTQASQPFLASWSLHLLFPDLEPLLPPSLNLAQSQQAPSRALLCFLPPIVSAPLHQGHLPLPSGGGWAGVGPVKHMRSFEKYRKERWVMEAATQGPSDQRSLSVNCGLDFSNLVKDTGQGHDLEVLDLKPLALSLNLWWDGSSFGPGKC